MLSDKRRAKIEHLIKESNRLMGYPGGLPTGGMGGMGGMPAYHKGGTVKKDGYLTDKKLKPYAKVQKGEKVVSKKDVKKKLASKLRAAPVASSLGLVPGAKALKKTKQKSLLSRSWRQRAAHQGVVSAK